ncbi:MAG: CpsD/CapB family tyrosine-protein kinase [Acidobacteria bacterium]|nr:CpsD/CapB family tyrosine-protein kinase [Acidobacteriota bacterium]
MSMSAPAALAWADEEMLVARHGAGLAGEQFRRMRIRLEGVNETLGGTMKVVLVTSPLMGDGKTATAANLAFGLAGESGRKVLLIDVDMRKPRLHEFFRGTARAGLGDVLVGGMALGDAVAPIDGMSLDLLALPRGADRRVDPLPIERLRALLVEARKRYDYIICDGPPVLPIADTAAAARLSDGIVLVVRAAITPRDAVARALGLVDRNRLVGFVLNAVPERTLDRYYYTYDATESEGGGARNGHGKNKRARGGPSD